MHILDSLQNILMGTFGILFAAGYIAWKLKRSWDAAEGEAAERAVTKQSFEQLKRDPRFHRVWQYIASRHRVKLEPTPDPGTYCVRYIELMDAKGQRLLGENEPGARWLNAYLERSHGSSRLQVTLDLETGTCTERELGWLAWSSAMPVMY